jgi:glutamyl-Q tRNA(Asp) synthetase
LKDEVGRFAPSTTGPAHPGTLLAALLCWLDARTRRARLVLRLEDLDPERARPALAARLAADLAWLGLDWDAVEVQSQARARHEAALDRLAALGRLYPCACSRSRRRGAAARAPDGGYRYDGRCRERVLPQGGWRASRDALRARLEPGLVTLSDESGADLSKDPAAVFGDPIVRRRDGAIAYHLASVVDDAAVGVTRVVRGRDLAASSATQVALQRLLGLPTPSYRHHLLLLEARSAGCRRASAAGGSAKLAKLHGAVSLAALRGRYDAPALTGWLAHAVGLLHEPQRVCPQELLPAFDWGRVRSEDRLVHWTGEALLLG